MPPKPRTPDEFWSMLVKDDETGCWIWPYEARRGGYGKTWWAGKAQSSHRVAFLIANGWLPQGRAIVIRHTCDQPSCCNPAHLIVGTQKDNARDRDERGRRNAPPTWTWHNAKFTPEQVREIRARHAAGESYTQLGAAFDMHPQNIGRIVRREGYADVT